MNRNSTANSKHGSRWSRFELIVEIAVFAIVAPALVAAVMDLKDLPFV